MVDREPEACYDRGQNIEHQLPALTFPQINREA